MVRRIPAGLAVTLMLLGGVSELVSFALPWARYRVDASSAQAPVDLHATPGLSVFQVSGGVQYLGLLILTVVLLAGALAGQPRVRPLCCASAMVLGIVCATMAMQVGSRARSTIAGVNAMGMATVHAHGVSAAGTVFGAVGPLLLGLGAFVAAWATTRTPVTAAAGT